MKATANRSDLADALAWVSQAISRRSDHSPVMQGIKIVPYDNDGTEIALSAFDYETHHRAIISADVSEPDSYPDLLASGSMLTGLVQGMRGQDVTLTLDDARLVLESGRASYRLPLLAIEDYPRAPRVPDTIGTLDAETFAAAVQAVAYAVSKDAVVESLTGVYLTASSGIFIMHATDRYQAASNALPWGGPDFTALVPVATLTGALKGVSGPVEVGVDDSSISLQSSDRLVVTRLLAGEFPRMDKIFDITPVATVEVDARELAAAVKLARTVSEEKVRTVRLDVALDSVTVSPSGDNDASGETIDATSDADMSAIFNADYLANACSGMTTLRVGFSSVTAARPVLFTDPARPDLARVLIPIRK